MKNNITKESLVKGILQFEVLVDARVTKEFVDHFFAILAETLVSGEEISLPGLGRFYLLDKKERTLHARKTGPLVLPPRRVVKFKANEAIIKREETAHG